MLATPHKPAHFMTTPNKYIVDCRKCGWVTSKAYAEEHKGKCRPCTTGEERKSKDQRKARSY